MAELNQIVSMLQEQRRELLCQLQAVDQAIAALGSAGADVTETAPVAPFAAGDHAASAVLPRRVMSRRVLTDVHKQALVVGRRKARNAREVAKGLAREMPDDAFVPAIRGRSDRQLPRLVKGPPAK